MAIDYRLDVVNPLEMALAGYQAGANILQQRQRSEQQSALIRAQEMEAQAKAQEVQAKIRAAEQQQQILADLYDRQERGVATTEDYTRAATMFEPTAQNLMAMGEAADETKRKNDFANLTSVYVPLARGNINEAKAVLAEQRLAAENAGDTQRAQVFNGMEQLLNQDPTAALMTFRMSRLQMDKPTAEAQDAILFAPPEKDPEAIRTARAYAETFGPEGSPAYIRAFRERLGPPGPTTVVNVGPEGRPLTPGQKKVDETFADTYAAFISGGASDTAKQITQLNSALGTLQTNRQLTGPLIGMLPDVAVSIASPQALALKQTVQEVVQRNLRAILGAQFTAKEGETLVDRAFDPRLPAAENIVRVQRLLSQIERANADTQRAVDYYEANGTLQGFKYRAPTKQSFFDAVSGKATSGTQMRDFATMSDKDLTSLDVSNLAPEDVAAVLAELDRRGL